MSRQAPWAIRDSLPARSGGMGDVSYTLTPDGQRFLMMKEQARPDTQIVVILNWAEELTRLVPAHADGHYGNQSHDLQSQAMLR